MIHDIGCFTIFATHFHELTQLQEEEKCVRNKHVAAHVEPGSSDVTFLFEVQEG
jgi:DNA mismatch repair protein MSH2